MHITSRRLRGHKTRRSFHDFEERRHSSSSQEFSRSQGEGERRNGSLPRSIGRCGLMEEALGAGSSAIDSSNIGFQLLKKQGWKEGTGLGIAEQGRLEPLQPHVKSNKRGLGAEKIKKKCVKLPEDSSSKEQRNNDHMESRKKAKALSKRLRKLQEEEKRMQEKEFERAFFREFWPDNV